MSSEIQKTAYSCPLNREAVLDAYFLENRARLLDVAAFLDRVARARPADNQEDFRLAAFRRALACLAQDDEHNAERILDILSDHTTDLPQSAHGMKGATGAPRNLAK